MYTEFFLQEARLPTVTAASLSADIAAGKMFLGKTLERLISTTALLLVLWTAKDISPTVCLFEYSTKEDCLLGNPFCLMSRFQENDIPGHTWMVKGNVGILFYLMLSSN